MGSIKNVLSEPIEGYEDYHVLVSWKSHLESFVRAKLNKQTYLILILQNISSKLFSLAGSSTKANPY